MLRYARNHDGRDRGCLIDLVQRGRREAMKIFNYTTITKTGISDPESSGHLEVLQFERVSHREWPSREGLGRT